MKIRHKRDGRRRPPYKSVIFLGLLPAQPRCRGKRQKLIFRYLWDFLSSAAVRGLTVRLFIFETYVENREFYKKINVKFGGLHHPLGNV